MIRAATGLAWASTEPWDAFEQGACADAVVSLARSEQYGQGVAAAVAGEVDFAGQASSGSAEGVIVRFVRPVPPSAGGGGMLVGADDGGVDLDQPVEVTGGLGRA